MPRTGNRLAKQCRVWELRRKGWSLQRIARELGIHHGNVSRILGRLDARSLARLQRRRDGLKVWMTYLLEYLIDEAMQAWTRSKGPGRTTRQTVERTAEGTIIGTTTTLVVERSGNPAFLLIVMEALEQLREIWGWSLQRPRRPPYRVRTDPATFSAMMDRHGRRRRPGPGDG